MNNKNPKYDNDLVTLGYLKDTFNTNGGESTELAKYVPKSYSSPPVPPYYKGSILYYNHNIYRCKYDRLQGTFNIDDWAIVASDESGFQQWVENTYVVDKANIETQVDKKIETYYQADDPATWSTDIEKARHEGDFWYRTTDNTQWRYSKFNTNPITYGWRHVNVPDEVFDLIDTKKSIYTSKPTSYNTDDMWIIEDDLPDADLPIGTEENPIIRGDWVFATQDSTYYDKSHWVKKDTDITMEYIQEYYYTSGEIENKIAEINSDILAAKQEVITQVQTDIDTQTGVINAISSRVDGYDSQIADIRIQYNDILSRISDIADLTTSGETTFATLDLVGINTSQPINIKIKPIGENISYLYPYAGLYPSSTLFMKTRTLRFTNKSEYVQTTDTKYTNYKKYYSYASDTYTLLIAGTDYTVGNVITGTVYENKYYDWELPTNLWYYNSTNFDDLELSFGNGDDSNVIVNRRCQINADGTTSILGTPTTETYPYPDDLILTDGDYTITLLGYDNAYLYVQLMSKNIYTTEFYTRVETNSQIEQKANEVMSTVNGIFSGYSNRTEMTNTIDQKIVDNNNNYVNIEVAKKVNNTDFTKAQIVAKINDNTSQVQIAADKVNLTGYITATNLATSGQTTINGGNITTGTISANRLDLSNYLTVGSASNTYATKSGLSNGTTTISGGCITTGTISSSRLASDVITTGNLSAQNISAAQITSGTLSTSRLSSDVITTSNFSAQNINASKITSGTLNGNNVSITNLKAGNIVSGTLNGNNVSITNLKAGNIKTGTLNGIPLSSCSYSFKKGSQEIKISTTSSYGIFTLWQSNTIRGVIDYGTFYAYNSSGSLGAYLNSSGVHTSSDIRYKKHIKNIEQQKSINIITNLTPIEYDYDTEEKHRGLSAQEVEEILNKNDYKNQVYNIDKDGKYSLNYIELIPDLINCIKYQQEEIETLKQEIEKLKEMIKNG